MSEHPLVALIGDLVLDIYRCGTIERTSPEAPGVPVVRVVETTHAPGGAANVAANVESLGGRAVVVGAIGADEAGRELVDMVRDRVVSASMVLIRGRPTTTKERIIVDGEPFARLDREETSDIDDARLIRAAVSAVGCADLVVISDYQKGVVTAKLCRAVIAAARARSIPVVVDPKCPDWERFAGATVLAPNEAEWEASGYDWPPEGANLLVKEGAEGLTLYRRGHVPLHVPGEPVESPDPTGAGDSAVAALAVAIGRGTGWEDAARAANAAGAEACRHAGTVAVRPGQSVDIEGVRR